MQTSKGVGNLIKANQNFLHRELADFTGTISNTSDVLTDTGINLV
jgi:hypothetical protein